MENPEVAVVLNGSQVIEASFFFFLYSFRVNMSVPTLAAWLSVYPGRGF